MLIQKYATTTTAANAAAATTTTAAAAAATTTTTTTNTGVQYIILYAMPVSDMCAVSHPSPPTWGRVQPCVT